LILLTKEEGFFWRKNDVSLWTYIATFPSLISQFFLGLQKRKKKKKKNMYKLTLIK
jgi:hypothetical protein